MREDMVQALLPDIDKINFWLKITNNIYHDDDEMLRILEEWAEQKQALFDAFGGKLQISKYVEFNKPDKIMEDNLCVLINYSYKSGAKFYNKLVHCLDYEFGMPVSLRNISYSTPESSRVDESTFQALTMIDKAFHADVLRTNSLASRWNSDQSVFKLTFSSGHILSISEGMKPMKLFNKLAKEFGLEKEFEEFRLEHSRILNDNKLKGKLTISIHPLDYMTMSDNNSDWSSCMSWMDHGDYHLGTVEMMNSPYVICAYLEGSHPMDLDYQCHQNIQWNNKKWRCLFICHNDAIVKVKSYPYQNDYLEEAVMDMISELYPNKYETTSYHLFKDYNYNYGCNYIDESNNSHWISTIFNCCHMYNDFSNDSHSIVRFNREVPASLNINYSGNAQCMCCGNIFEPFLDSEVCCANCLNLSQCSHCGEYIYDDDAYYDNNGECYCESCYNDLFLSDPILKETVRKEDLSPIFLIPEEIVEKFKKAGLLSEDGLTWNSKDNNLSSHLIFNFDLPIVETLYNEWKNDSWYQKALKNKLGQMPIESVYNYYSKQQILYIPISDWFNSKYQGLMGLGHYLLSSRSNRVNHQAYRQYIEAIDQWLQYYAVIGDSAFQKRIELFY